MSHELFHVEGGQHVLDNNLIDDSYELLTLKEAQERYKKKKLYYVDEGVPPYTLKDAKKLSRGDT
jgi:hypothetical protein